MQSIFFFDIESTGLSTVNDRIVEISWCVVEPELGDYANSVRVNPGIPISAEATAVHGIADEDVKGLPPFSKYADDIYALITSCGAVGGFNITRYDIPLLAQELLRYNPAYVLPSDLAVYDAAAIFHQKEPRTLSAALEFYCNREHVQAHSARADVDAAIDVFREQVRKYNLPVDDPKEMTLLSLHKREVIDWDGKFVYDAKGRVVFNFSKHKGEPVHEHAGMLTWMLDPSKAFALDTLTWVRRFLVQIRETEMKKKV